jgi:hypothetical protein
VDGRETDHLAFKDTGVDWELWVASTGDPLPVKGCVKFTQNKRLKKADLAFSNWNFAPQIANDLFDPKMPAGYEGVAIVQRARVLRNMPKDEAAPTGGDVKK